MHSKLIALIAISVVAQCGPLLAAEGVETSAVARPIIINQKELQRLRAENAALKTENASLKAENANLKAEMLEYELALKELAQKIENLIQNKLSVASESSTSILQDKLNELKEVEATLGQSVEVPANGAQAKKIPWKKISKTLRLIADIIDIWAN